MKKDAILLVHFPIQCGQSELCVFFNGVAFLNLILNKCVRCVK